MPYEFHPKVEKAAQDLELEISPQEIKKRRDFRTTTTFTIDPKDAKDFDDALSLKKLDNGNWEIGIPPNPRDRKAEHKEKHSLISVAQTSLYTDNREP